MKKNRLAGIAKILLVTFSIFLFYQCMHDEFDFSKLDDEIEIVGGFLSPLAYGSLSLDDLFSEFDSSSVISTYPDGLMYITYTDSLFSFIADDLLQIPSQDFVEFFIESDFTSDPLFPGWNAGDTLPIDRSTDFIFIFNNREKLDSLILDQGSLVFAITSEFQHTGNIKITCPNIRSLSNEPFTRTIPIDDPSGGFTFNQSYSLTNYTIHLNDSVVSVDSSFRYMPVDFEVELINSGAGINAGERITVNTTIENLDFEAIFGYIGDYELLSQAGSLDLSFFDNVLDGFIEFADPKINFNITNSYGVPAAVNIARFTGFNANGDSVLLSISDPLISPFRYVYPGMPDYFSSDIYKESVLSIHKDNSSVVEFLATFPTRLEYNMAATSNPDGEGAAYNFVSDDSKIDIDFEFILPLWFKADSFALKDTMDLDLISIDDDASFIEKLSLKLEVSNGLPLDIDFQIYFLDSLYNPVDTLFAEGTQPIIPSGLIGADNLVKASGLKTSLITYTKDDIAKLNTVRYGVMRAGLKTPTVNNVLTAVKFYSDYKVSFKISTGVEVRANSNEF